MRTLLRFHVLHFILSCYTSKRRPYCAPTLHRPIRRVSTSTIILYGGVNSMVVRRAGSNDEMLPSLNREAVQNERVQRLPSPIGRTSCLCYLWKPFTGISFSTLHHYFTPGFIGLTCTDVPKDSGTGLFRYNSCSKFPRKRFTDSRKNTKPPR